MLGLLFRFQLLLSFVIFLIQLGVISIIRPYRSFIFAALIFTWIGFSAVSTHTTTETQPSISVTQSPLFTLLIQDYSDAGFVQTEVLSTELQTRQQFWESQQLQLPAARDILLNGALLYYSLGDVFKAQELYKLAQDSDPNNRLFSLQLDQFFE